jgi:hypothetical protein
MKVVDFPKEKTGQDDVKEMLTQVVDQVEENEVSQAVVVMMSEDGSVGMSVSGTPLDIIAMLSVALKEI